LLLLPAARRTRSATVRQATEEMHVTACLNIYVAFIMPQV
jgi:hypothetical protein